MLFILAVAVLLNLSACSAGDPCPPKHSLAPCTCSHLPLRNLTVRLSAPVATTLAPVTTTASKLRPQRDVNDLTPSSLSSVQRDFYTIVDCKVSKSIQALEETVSSALNRKLIDKLVVSNVPPPKEHTLSRLPSGWLKKIRVRQFEVTHTKLSGDFIWYGNPFEGQAQSLLWFAANKCSLTGSLTYDTDGTVNSRGLNSLPLVQGVDFSDNYLTFISSTSFRYPPTNLSSVILSRNSIQSVEPGAFQYIPLLRYIDLSNNLLESLLRTIFASPARHLEYIDLSWNSLTTITPDFFVNMPSLKIVNISNNFLYSMPEKPWALVWRQLKVIDVTGNFIECNCDLTWLLAILSPTEGNSTTTPSPRPLPGQEVSGYCSKTIQPRLFANRYDLVTLRRDRLSC